MLSAAASAPNSRPGTQRLLAVVRQLNRQSGALTTECEELLYGRPQPPRKRRVRVDWANVSEDDLRRCPTLRNMRTEQQPLTRSRSRAETYTTAQLPLPHLTRKRLQ